MDEYNRNRIELLAPAGNLEIFRTVLHAGADAVYLAGSHYGARAYAGNLSDEELLTAINEAHVYGRRLYLTVNTLCKEDELNGLYDYILPLYEAGLDGVIIQDIGVMAYLHEHFPGLELHASTQMTVTNTDFIPVLKKYGVTRIVPARELSLKEIHRLHEESGMEIECFVHGALCYCYSGVCFMSSFMGGRSGNRGRCAQPCRLSYRRNSITQNLLSLKDLSTLDILPDLVENGVYSMKIEGRMKSAEYAAGITEIYRKYVDLYLEQGREGYRVDPKDKEHLLWLFDRGGTTSGYYQRHNGREMLAEPEKSDKSQEAKKQYEEGVLERCQRGDYRLPVRLDAEFRVGKPAVLTLSCITDGKEYRVQTVGAVVDRAMKRAMTEAELEKSLGKCGDTFFRPVRIKLDMDSDIFIPVSVLNELRRQGIAELMKAMTAPYRRDGKAVKTVEPSEPSERSMLYEGKMNYSVHCMTGEQALTVLSCDSFCRNGFRMILDTEWMTQEDIREVLQKNRNRENGAADIYLGLPRIMRDGYDNAIRELLSLFAEEIKGAVARSLGQICFVRDNYPKLEILGDYTCYGMNSRAVREIFDLSPRLASLTYPVEANAHELMQLGAGNFELYAYGRIPLMTTANCIEKSTDGCRKPEGGLDRIRDRKNAELPVIYACRYCYNLILNSVPVYLADKREEILRLQPGFMGIHFTTEDGRETEAVLSSVVQNLPYTEGEFTRGHFVKGVE